MRSSVRHRGPGGRRHGHVDVLRAPSQRRKQEALLQRERIGRARPQAREVSGGRVARAAASRPSEIAPAGLRIAGQHVDRRGGRAVAGHGVDTLTEEMREVHDLRLGQRRGVRRRRRAHRRPDAGAETVAEDGGRSDQIRAVRSALGRAAVAVDAVLRVEPPAARRRGLIERRPIGGTALSRQRDRQQDDGEDPNARAGDSGRTQRQRHMA